MDKLEGVSGATLREKLDSVKGAKATKRLMVAIAYKDGVPVSELAERYAIPKSTLYYWLDRMAEKPLNAAVADDDRPGRPSELENPDRQSLFQAVEDTPDRYGYDESAWTPELVQQHIEREFDVSYSLGHVRRLLRNENVSLRN